MEFGGKQEIFWIFTATRQFIQLKIELKEKFKGERDDEQEGQNKNSSAVPQPPPKNDEKVWINRAYSGGNEDGAWLGLKETSLAG